MGSLARTASIAGLVALVSILSAEVIVPSLIAGGPPLSGTLDRAAITAYYAHPGMELFLGLGLFAVALPAFLVFAVTIRELAAADPGARYPATVGAAFAVCAVPVYIFKAAIAAALVGVVANGLDPVSLFRVYDLAYNGAIYPLEAAYVLGLGLAVAALSSGLGWIRWISIVVAALQLANAGVLFAGLPSAIALPGNLAFSVWLAATSVALWRLDAVRYREPVATAA